MTTIHDEQDPLSRALRTLPERPPDELAAARIHHQARAAFARAGRPADRWLHRLERVYARLEPVLAVGVSAIYLAWAVSVLASLR
jgi:hypothetical protein